MRQTQTNQKATPYYYIAKPTYLKGSSGKIKPGWEKKKWELKDIFAREVLWRMPENSPASVWEIIEEKDSLFGSCGMLGSKN